VVTQEFNKSASERLKGISKVILTAFHEERLYSTNDYPWMKTGKIIDINKDNIEQLLKEKTE
jgi:hypothetical protein